MAGEGEGDGQVGKEQSFERDGVDWAGVVYGFSIGVSCSPSVQSGGRWQLAELAENEC